jgi:hypothetical protein
MVRAGQLQGGTNGPVGQLQGGTNEPMGQLEGGSRGPQGGRRITFQPKKGFKEFIER